MSYWEKSEEFAQRLMEFAVRLIKLAEALPNIYTAKHISKQMIRSGTSIGANYEEARGAESKSDFVHKLTLSLKEARETLYWLKLVHNAEYLKPGRLEPIIDESKEICAILVSSIKTLKTNK